MPSFPESMSHGEIREVFKDVFFVPGTMKSEFFGSLWQFSRNMTIVREDGKLTILNSVRLNDEGLSKLEKLGKVTNVVRLGDMHGIDDPFYVDRYHATFWALPGMKVQDGLKVDKLLEEGGEMPIRDCTLFQFNTVQRPECILRLDREGGIMIACDSLQNWVEPDEFFDEETIPKMKDLNFFKTAGVGPVWIREYQPGPSDFERLKKIPYQHALCGHGYPLINNAQNQYLQTFHEFFNI